MRKGLRYDLLAVHLRYSCFSPRSGLHHSLGGEPHASWAACCHYSSSHGEPTRRQPLAMGGWKTIAGYDHGSANAVEI